MFWSEIKRSLWELEAICFIWWVKCKYLIINYGYIEIEWLDGSTVIIQWRLNIKDKDLRIKM